MCIPKWDGLQRIYPGECIQNTFFPPLGSDCSDDSDCGIDEGCYNGACLSTFVGEAKSAKGKIIDDTTAECLVANFHGFTTSIFLLCKSYTI